VLVGVEDVGIDMPVADAPDAVDWPLISAWTDALNDALMPAKL